MIFAKDIKKNRLLFIILMIIEELFLVKVTNFDIWFYVFYMICTYLILKLLYKEKSQITDIFIFIIASLMMLGINAIVYFIILFTIKKFKIYAILSRILLFIILFIFRHKFYNITKLYKKIWNRDDSIPKKIKTTTFRSLNVVLFNITFYLVHIILIFEIAKNGGV